MLTIETLGGDHIKDVIGRAIAMAFTAGETVQFKFNGVAVTVDSSCAPDLVYRDWARALAGCIGQNIGPTYAATLTEAVAKCCMGLAPVDECKCANADYVTITHKQLDRRDKTIAQAALDNFKRNAEAALAAMDAPVTEAEVEAGTKVWLSNLQDTSRSDADDVRAVLVDFLTTRIAARAP